jgi:hypothetical protein
VTSVAHADNPNFILANAPLELVNLFEELLVAKPDDPELYKSFLASIGKKQYPIAGDDAKYIEDPKLGTTYLIDFEAYTATTGGYNATMGDAIKAMSSGSIIDIYVKDLDLSRQAGKRYDEDVQPVAASCPPFSRMRSASASATRIVRPPAAILLHACSEARKLVKSGASSTRPVSALQKATDGLFGLFV